MRVGIRWEHAPSARTCSISCCHMCPYRTGKGKDGLEDSQPDTARVGAKGHVDGTRLLDLGLAARLVQLRSGSRGEEAKGMWSDRGPEKELEPERAAM